MAKNENLLSASNSTQKMDWNYYDWCTDYPTGPVIWSAVSMVCFLLGLPASLWVLHELTQRQRQRATSDVFMLGLTIYDLIFTAQVPFCVCNFLLWHIQQLQNVFLFMHSLCVGRPLFMACICWECYVAVVHPIVYRTSKKFIVVKKLITITISFFVAVCGLVIGSIQWLLTTPLLAVPLIMALPVIAFCDSCIFLTLRKPDPTGKNNIHRQKKRALHTIFNSFIMTFVVYLPPLFIFSFGKLILQGEIEIFCCSAPYAFIFSTAGCVIMPVLYLISVGKLDTLWKRWKS